MKDYDGEETAGGEKKGRTMGKGEMHRTPAHKPGKDPHASAEYHKKNAEHSMVHKEHESSGKFGMNDTGKGMAGNCKNC